MAKDYITILYLLEAMQMRPNIGMINALIRITCGFTLLAWATAKLVRRPSSMKAQVFAVLGAMKVGEGITRFCPVVYLYEENMKQEMNNSGEKTKIDITDEEDYYS